MNTNRIEDALVSFLTCLKGPFYWRFFEGRFGKTAISHDSAAIWCSKMPITRHGLHNNSTPRYNEANARIAWDRTIAFFKKS